jgi:hypothetical protein
MRTSTIALIVAACAVSSACTKKSSLFLEPGRSEASQAAKSVARTPARAPVRSDARPRPQPVSDSPPPAEP